MTARRHSPNPRIKLLPRQHLESRGVLAGAYRGRDISERTLLTHGVIMEGPREVRALCGFDVDRLADVYSASDADKALPPTCARCRVVWDRLTREHAPNGAGHYVWVVRADNVPLSGEGPYGPFGRQQAEQFARIGAQEGKHDRAVSRGDDPSSPDFAFVSKYQQRTGDRLW